MLRSRLWTTLAAGLVSACLLPSPAFGADGPVRTGAPAAAAATRDTDLKERLAAIPGMTVVQEKQVDGYRFFVLTYTQPVDHDHPGRGSFQQRLTVLHRGADRPTVFSASGYGLPADPGPSRSEPTRLLDANQVSLEYRFFRGSEPATGGDWSTLNVRQATADQHAVFTALKELYPGRWIATGGSKGGMNAAHYERFHPGDMDGTVAYVAPDDAARPGDRAYADVIRSNGTPECRAAIAGAQVEALRRRTALTARYEQYARDNGYTFSAEFMGSADKALEAVVVDTPWAFWQYGTEADCAAVPGRDATDQQLWDWFDGVDGFSFYTDQTLSYYAPYYYQAATELGAPEVAYPELKGLLKYRISVWDYIPDKVARRRFDPGLTRDVDRWIRRNARNTLFVYGGRDPWSAERFGVSARTRDSHVLTVADGNHGASITALAPADRTLATDALRRWAGLPPAGGSGLAASPAPAPYDAVLDAPDPAERHRLPGLPG
ncbi:S28 family serine protease [Kitasatospora sp. DSM 101779]|uniref:S28 family serine protease n=1 Tax=Kitasatospora sp. DSM 101779 TaxID=2853165 RepID=UPI0039874CB6